MHSHFFCYLAILVGITQFQWGFEIPSGWSSVSFNISTATSPDQIFGEQLVNVEQIVGIEGQRFSLWSTSSPSSGLLTLLMPDQGYFIKTRSSFNLAGTGTYSQMDYPLTTGYQLIPLKSEESLQSLTQPIHPWSQRLYSVWGLYANRWYAFYPGQNLAYAEAVNQILSTSSVLPLTALTPGQAYFVGLRPLLKKIELRSIKLSSGAVRGARLDFDAMVEPNLLNQALLSNSLMRLGAPLTDSNGNWSGEIFLPQNSKVMAAQWQAINGASTTYGSDLLPNEFRYSTHTLDPTSSIEVIHRLNFSPLSNLIYFERLRDTQSSQSTIASHFLGQFLEQESAGFSQFNSAPLDLFGSPSRVINPLNQVSFLGANFTTPESDIINLAHQIGNGIIERRFPVSHQFLNSMLDSRSNFNEFYNIYQQNLLNSLREGLDDFKDLDRLFSPMINLGGPSLRFVGNPSSNQNFLVLNAIRFGNSDALISFIDDGVAELIPLNSEQFVFSDYPEFLSIPLGSQNGLEQVTGMLNLSLISKNESQVPFARVTALNFVIGRSDRQSLCPFSGKLRQWQMCVQIEDNSLIKFHYKYQLQESSGIFPNSLDSGDTHLSPAGFIEIPILAYVSKASSELTDKFRDLDLELRINTQGIKFSLNGSDSLVFEEFYIRNLRVNSN